jgi:hypothetical protein
MGAAMTRICWWLVDIVSRMLEPAERDAVRGDFAELGETSGQALRDVLGLVVRRQAALWKDWRPWLALVGLVAPLSMLLSLVSRRTADGSAIYVWLYANNWDWFLLGNAGLRHLFAGFGASIFMSYLNLICWSWTSGFMLGSLSRRTIRVNGALFGLALLLGELLGAPQHHNSLHTAVFSLTFYNVMFPLIVQAVLVLLPSLWGMHQGVRLAALSILLQIILWVCAILSILTMAALAASNFPTFVPRSWWNLLVSRQMWLVAVYWPVGYMVAAVSWRRWRRRENNT